MTVAATGAAGLVGDVWKDLPVRSGIADVVLCVFAPRNGSEFRRILRPSGSLIVVTPRPNHLEQLRARGEVIGIQPDKLEHLDNGLDSHFELQARTTCEHQIVLSTAERQLLASMGPSGHHALGGAADETGEQPVTVAVDVSTFSAR